MCIQINGLIWDDYMVFIERFYDLLTEFAAGAEVLVDAVCPYSELKYDAVLAYAAHRNRDVFPADLRLAFECLADQGTDEIEVRFIRDLKLEEITCTLHVVSIDDHCLIHEAVRNDIALSVIALDHDMTEGHILHDAFADLRASLQELHLLSDFKRTGGRQHEAGNHVSESLLRREGRDLRGRLLDMLDQRGAGHSREVRKDCASVILWCAEKATWMAGEGIQIFGGNGYTNEYPLGRYWRDAKLYEIGAGTSEIRRMLVGRELFNETK